jgi:hypothetical protein
MRRHRGTYALDSLQAVVAAYIADYRGRAREEQQFFAGQRTLPDAVRLAGLAEGPKGKRFSHQRRIPRAVLNRASALLLDRLWAINAASTFEDLHDAVAETIGDVEGIGELTVYDTALRVAAKRGLEPRRVYLHAGTRAGARALGFTDGADWILPNDLPRAFRRLRPMEIEDCLCIYKAELRRLADGNALGVRERSRRVRC